MHDFLGHKSATEDEVENIAMFFDEDDTGDLHIGEVLTCIRYLVKARVNPSKWSVTISDENVTGHLMPSIAEDSMARTKLPHKDDPLRDVLVALRGKERLQALGFSCLEELLVAHEAGIGPTPSLGKGNSKPFQLDSQPRRKVPLGQSSKGKNVIAPKRSTSGIHITKQPSALSANLSVVEEL